MAYPFPSIGSFIFSMPDERPIGGTDTRWKPNPSRDRSSNLGSAADSIRTLAAGSRDRSFEVMLEPDRFDELEALIGIPGQTFTDWKRPVPDARGAYLANVVPVEEVAALCTDNTIRLLVRTRVELISQ